MRSEYGKVIKPGQLVTVNNIVYRCRKLKLNECVRDCETCDLLLECDQLPFGCEPNSYFKRVRRKRFQKPD